MKDLGSTTNPKLARAAGAVYCGLVLVSALTSFASLGAYGADNGLWSIFPTSPTGQRLARPYLEPLMSPGVVVQDSVTISNRTAASMNFNLYAVDAFNTKDGAFALRRNSDPRSDMGSWIHLPTGNLTIPANTAANIPLFIFAPADATPG